MSPSHRQDYPGIGLRFTEALLSRDYATAYAMTSTEYQRRTTQEQMRAGFESSVPPGWQTVGPLEVVTTMEDWPDKQPADVGWAYVSIGGTVYSEGLTVVVARQDDLLRIRTVEFGRP